MITQVIYSLEKGVEIEWTIQMASAITVSRRGWNRDSLCGRSSFDRDTSCKGQTVVWNA